MLTEKPMNRVDAWRMTQRRAADLGTLVKLGCQTRLVMSSHEVALVHRADLHADQAPIDLAQHRLNDE